MIALIMAGGIGSRFWPLSREAKPKQYLQIASERTMIQMTVDRLLEKIPMTDIYIVTGESQVKLVAENLPNLPEENIIVEPFGMNTAPCIALSAEYLSQKYAKDEVMTVLAADHLIKDTAEFHRTLDIAENAAKDDNLVTFGIKPDYPATGYGYVEAGDECGSELFYVKQFKEKPNFETAESFIDAGNFYWNSGMFAWKLDTILDAYQTYLPKVSTLLKGISDKWKTDGRKANIDDEFGQMPKLPVDIGIMEQAEKRVVIPVDYGWSDVGGWKALYDISAKDANGNILKCENTNIDSTNNLVISDKHIALIGVDNLIVIETEDAILISRKDRSEEVKNIINDLKDNDKTELL
jgi:mannose-1-phosphate guanylyltransferase